MAGLIDTDTGLTFGEGLIWLADGLGGVGLVIQAIPAEAMITQDGDEMITQTGIVMETQ